MSPRNLPVHTTMPALLLLFNVGSGDQVHVFMLLAMSYLLRPDCSLVNIQHKAKCNAYILDWWFSEQGIKL